MSASIPSLAQILTPPTCCCAVRSAATHCCNILFGNWLQPKLASVDPDIGAAWGKPTFTYENTSSLADGTTFVDILCHIACGRSLLYFGRLKQKIFTSLISAMQSFARCSGQLLNRTSNRTEAQLPPRQAASTANTAYRLPLSSYEVLLMLLLPKWKSCATSI